jgi:hypothetical protein
LLRKTFYHRLLDSVELRLVPFFDPSSVGRADTAFPDLARPRLSSERRSPRSVSLQLSKWVGSRAAAAGRTECGRPRKQQGCSTTERPAGVRLGDRIETAGGGKSEQPRQARGSPLVLARPPARDHRDGQQGLDRVCAQE